MSREWGQVNIVDQSGELVQHYVYSPFGKIIRIENAIGEDVSNSPTIDNFYTFTGREYDSESGLYYFRARYLDSESGRFIQSDPHPGSKSAPLSLINKYIYAGNSPYMFNDPSGKMYPLLAILIVAVAAAAVEATIREVSGKDHGKSWFQNFSSSAVRNFIVGVAIYYGGPPAGSEGLSLGTEFYKQIGVEAFKLAFANPMGKLQKQYDKQKSHNKIGVALLFGVGYLGVSSVAEGQAAAKVQAWAAEYLPDEAESSMAPSAAEGL